MATKQQVPVLGAVISTTIIPATTKEFVVKDNFIIDTSRKAKVKLPYLGSEFKEWFWEKTEEPFAGSTVYGRKLNKGSVDNPILFELGDYKKAETTMAEIYVMMARQANGESGNLLNSGYTNVFYVRDINDVLRAVSVLWFDDGWRIGAHSVEYPDGWDAGSRVFSRNSLVPQAA